MNIFTLLLFFSSAHLRGCISQTNDQMIQEGIKRQDYATVRFLLNEEKVKGNLTRDILKKYKQLSKISMPKNVPSDYCVKPGTRLSRIGGRIAYGTFGFLNMSAAIISLLVISDLKNNHDCLNDMYNSVENTFARLSLSFAMAAAGTLGTFSCCVACSGKQLIFPGNESSSGIYGLLTVMKKELENQSTQNNDSFV